MPKWTRNDEDAYNDTRRRMEELEARRNLARTALHSLMTDVFGPDVSDDDVEAAINNAAMLRDALEPFDDGVRCRDEVA